jgi:hypothetical protein
MSGRITSASLAAAWVLVALARSESVAHAQSFAADLDAIQAGGGPRAPLGRLYVSDGKVRIETRQLPDGFFLVDADAGTAWFLRPRQRVFMEARRSSPLTQTFVRVDPDDACRQWQIMENVAGSTGGPGAWRCDRAGEDTIDGRRAVKYQTVSAQGRRSAIWVDPERRFPVRIESEDGSVVSLERIVDAPQPASLFTRPGDYRQFDPSQLIEQIKKSDVWVDRPRGGGR